MDILKKQSEMLKGLLVDCNLQLEHEPDNLELVQLRALIYNVNELYDEAITDLTKIIERQPDNSGDPYFLRADCFLKKDKYNLAKQDYLRALRLTESQEEEFIKSHTEERIRDIIINNKEEILEIAKVLQSERVRIFLKHIGRD